jgi:hypothetical protein
MAVTGDTGDMADMGGTDASSALAPEVVLVPFARPWLASTPRQRDDGHVGVEVGLVLTRDLLGGA